MINHRTLPYFAARILSAMHACLGDDSQRPYCFHIVPTHKAAPCDLATLRRQAELGRVTISSEDCNSAIYGRSGNLIFRMFHDAGHLTHGLDMTLTDELILFQRQWAELRPHIPEDDRWYCNLIWQADTAGQGWLEHFTGKFPEDQTAFVIAIAQAMQPGTLNVKDAVHRYVYGAP